MKRETIAIHHTGRRLGLALFAAGGLLAGGCDSFCGDDECSFTKEEWELVRTLSPLPDPQLDPTNRFDGDPAAIELGQMLFFEKRYSKALRLDSYLGKTGDSGKVSCATCHDPEQGFSDTKSNPNNMSIGVSWTTRNTPALVNTVYYGKSHGWDLRQDSLWNQGSLTMETGTNSAGDRCDVAHMMWTHYRDRYNAIFTGTPLPEELDPAHPNAARYPATCRPNAAMPGNWEKMPAEDRTAVNQVMANIGKSIAAYEAKLISRRAPFDRYVSEGERTAISDQAKRGLKLFVGKGSCIACHSGPFFTDLTAHNLGVAQIGPNVPTMDLGLYNGIPQLRNNTFKSDGSFSDDVEAGKQRNAWLRDPVDADKGRFRTQSLRNLTQSAPYMHTGMFATLESVVRFYNEGGATSGFAGEKDPWMRPLAMTEQEIRDLVAFLETLTGEPIPAELRRNPHQ